VSVGSSRASIDGPETPAAEDEDDDEDDESVRRRSSTLTSVCVALGGRESRTVRKVSWSRTACQTLRRCCFSKKGASGVTREC